jgi:hypothetical protein
MAVDHVEMPLVDRQIDRLAHRAARMMERGRHIGELHEILEVGDGRIAAAAIEVAHEGRAIDRREDRGIAADLHVPLRVAGVLDVLLRGRFLHDRAGQAAREMDAGPLHIGAGVFPQFQRFRLVAEFDADFLKDRVGIPFDDAETLFATEMDPFWRSQKT